MLCAIHSNFLRRITVIQTCLNNCKITEEHRNLLAYKLVYRTTRNTLLVIEDGTEKLRTSKACCKKKNCTATYSLSFIEEKVEKIDGKTDFTVSHNRDVVLRRYKEIPEEIRSHFLAEVEEYGKLYSLTKEVSLVPNKGKEVWARVIKVIDGDTVRVVFLYEGVPVSYSIRLRGIDCPEKSRASPLEMKCGKLVGDYLRSVLPEMVKLQVLSHDKYGGRLVGSISFSGVDVSEHLLEKGYAYTYNGKEKKEKWNETTLKRMIVSLEKDLLS